MPYIEGYRREALDYLPQPQSVGELNYVVTRLALQFLGDNPSYADYNDVIGVLECAKLEFYRRAAAKYEDVKIQQNGDVYNGS